MNYGRAQDPAILFGRLEQLFRDVGTVLTTREVEEQLVPALLRATGALAGSVAIRSGDEVEIFTAQGYSPELLTRFGRFPLDAAIPLAETIRTGETIVLGGTSEWARRFPALETVAEHPGVTVAVARGDEVVAAIGLSYEDEQPFDQTQMAFLSALGTHVAALLERVDLFERTVAAESRHRALTRSMAASLLPPALPRIPGYSVAARHETGADDIGGDFVDAIPLPGRRWAIVVGDVQGRGHDAAAVGSLARQVIRAGTSAYDTPTGLLEHLNRALLEGLSGIDPPGGEEPGVDAPRFVTVAVAVLAAPEEESSMGTGDMGPGSIGTCDMGPGSTGAGRRQVTLSLAGHPQPLLATANGLVQPVGRPGGLLGLLPGPSLSDTTVILRPGDTLVLFTDGLTERRRKMMFFDEQAVAPLLVESVGMAADEIADVIIEAANAFAGEHRDDDTAIVVIQPA